MAKSSELQKYVTLARQLQRVDVAGADVDTRLAFFINIYNALVVHATAVRGAPTNLWQRYKVSVLLLNKSYSMQNRAVL